MTRRRAFWIPAFAGMTLLFFINTAAHAVPIQEVSGGGVTAWLAEDHKLPIVAMQFAFRGGVEQDPIDKQGLAHLSVNLLTEGAGTYDAAAFQKKLADRSIALNFSAERDQIAGSMKTLSADKQEAFALLAMALTEPKMDTRDFERLRGEQLSSIRAQFGSPEWQARYALFQKVFAGHPYAERRLGTLRTVAGLTRLDAKNFIATHLARDNLVISVAGDMTPSELSTLLKKTFGRLPRHAQLTSIGESTWPKDSTLTLVPREGTQTDILFAMPGPKNDDPDWYAVQIANYILGGGGFSSRLMQDVRDKKGLTYGIETGLAPAKHGAAIIGEAATDNGKTAEAWSIALATMRHFYEDGATPKEIAAAKDYLTGSLPLALVSTDKIAAVLTELQLDGRSIDYLDHRNDHIRGVTPDDVNDAIHRWFNPDMLSVSMVGHPDGIVPTDVKDQVRE